MNKIWIELIIMVIFGISIFAKNISIGLKIDFGDCLFTGWISGLIGGVGGFLIRHFN